MIDDSESKRCENVLLLILPLFESVITEPDPDAKVPVDNLSDNERRARSFKAKFLVEVRNLRRLIRSFNDHDGLDRTSGDFVKNLSGILTLFDCNVGPEVLVGATDYSSHNALVLGDHTFSRLGALDALLAAGPDGSGLVTRITTDAKQEYNMMKIQKYNRRLERFLGVPPTSIAKVPTVETGRAHPSYEVRQFLDKLHDLLVKTWVHARAPTKPRSVLPRLETRDGILQPRKDLSYKILIFYCEHILNHLDGNKAELQSTGQKIFYGRVLGEGND
ncbi:hypothetical protein BKA65DRAFT_476678 [Rhexocercosporidium sp. MPI-PUGE-AT-0058]|nr:hypothetical protein BKA65DRAFT_476678 [Rhexocercosporidium sp. MPI-PUGE-AT-0058]